MIWIWKVFGLVISVEAEQLMKLLLALFLLQNIFNEIT